MTAARDKTKAVVGWVAGYGATAITYGVIKNNTNLERIDLKIAAVVASVALAGAVSETAKAQSDKLVDAIFDAIEGVKES